MSDGTINSGKAGRIRAGLVFIDDGKILLMYRFKNGQEYYAFPGGGVEDNETIEKAAVREAEEETGLKVTVGKRLWEYENNGQVEYFYLIDSFSGDLKLGGPEEARQSKDNIYRLKWVPLGKVKDLRLFPDEIKARFLKEFSE